MKQAKQQSQDLRQTDEFLTTIMKPGYSEKEKAAKPSPLEGGAPRQMNGRPKMPRVDSFSRFSEPPAPPPQQPLPQKPDAPPRSAPDVLSPLKRSDTEKPKAVGTNSPVSRDSSQILSLIEALSSAKREIDTQGGRIKELETLLRQERAAREQAEERANHKDPRPALDHGEVKAEPAPDTLLAKEPEFTQEHQPLGTPTEINGQLLSPEISTPSDVAQDSENVTTKQLQRRLETMMQEMQEMRRHVASFKARAEKAEEESTQAHQSLAEMIETLRRERTEKTPAMVSSTKTDAHVHDSVMSLSGYSAADKHDAAQSEMASSLRHPFDPVSSSQSKDLEPAARAFATQRHQRKFLEQSSPYASALGVVLLGVGLMALLNGWQKVDK